MGEQNPSRNRRSGWGAELRHSETIGDHEPRARDLFLDRSIDHLSADVYPEAPGKSRDQFSQHEAGAAADIQDALAGAEFAVSLDEQAGLTQEPGVRVILVEMTLAVEEVAIPGPGLGIPAGGDCIQLVALVDTPRSRAALVGKVAHKEIRPFSAWKVAFNSSRPG